MNTTKRLIEQLEKLSNKKVVLKEGYSVKEIMNNKKLQLVFTFNTSEDIANRLEQEIQAAGLNLVGDVSNTDCAFVTTLLQLSKIDSLFTSLGIEVESVEVFDNADQIS